MNLLEQMARSSQQREAAFLRDCPLEEAHSRCAVMPPAPTLRLGAFDLIAECKLRAPSAGRLGVEGLGPADIAARAELYAAAGAAAVSILTEPLRFDGELAHLAMAAPRSQAPVMRKDFLVGVPQVYEARLAGAGGVLLITRMLSDERLADMLDACSQVGMFALVECFDRQDCERTTAAVAGRTSQILVGVNTRDLSTLQVVPDRLARLVDYLPADRPLVAESGMHSPEDVAAAAALGYRVALVGTALMRASDPGLLVSEMIAAGSARCG